MNKSPRDTVVLKPNLFYNVLSLESSYLFSCSGFGMLCELIGVMWKVSGKHTYRDVTYMSVINAKNSRS